MLIPLCSQPASGFNIVDANVISAQILNNISICYRFQPLIKGKLLNIPYGNEVKFRVKRID